MKKQTFFLLLFAMMVTGISQAQNAALKDHLSVPGPIVLQGKTYALSWTSHPAENFYKQEYIVKGDNPDQYKTMILVDVVTGETDIKSVVSTKLQEIKQLKAGNPMVNYEVITNAKTGEYMIDFLLTANGADGKATVVERNVYRYKSITTKSGLSGVLLFGVSSRAYGKNIDSFFLALSKNRKELINTVAKFNLPAISTKN